jgi:hypothetical protein
MHVCRECGTNEGVHRGLCAKCRKVALGAPRGRVTMDPRLTHPAHHEDTEPPHDQPWVPRSALADRIRRSPRR